MTTDKFRTGDRAAGLKATWQTSSYCIPAADGCVAVAPTGAGVAVQDNTVDGPMIVVPHADWAVFVRALRTAELVAA